MKPPVMLLVLALACIVGTSHLANAQSGAADDLDGPRNDFGRFDNPGNRTLNPPIISRAVAFEGMNNRGRANVIDPVTVEGSSGSLLDLAAISVDFPAGGTGVVPQFEPFLPKATFLNNGSSPLSADVRFEIINRGTMIPEHISDLNLHFLPGIPSQVGFVPVLTGLGPGEYTTRAIVLLPGDHNPLNDTASGAIYVAGPPVPVSETAPYTEDFEGGALRSLMTSPIWYVVGTPPDPPATPKDWVQGNPAKTQISRAHSGNKAFITKTTGDYSHNQESFLYAPTLDLSAVPSSESLGVAFFMNFKTESKDGCVLEVSIDNGSTWNRVDSTLGTGANYNTPISVGWYNEGTGGGNLDPPYWGGGEGGGTSSADYQNPDDGWVLAATRVPGVTGNSNVQFRWRFSSDSSGSSEGFAIDNVTFSASPVFFTLPKTKNMGAVAIGSSKTDSFVVSSVGTYLLNIATENLEGPSTFSLTPVGPVSLGPGNSATYVITYTPDSVGPQSAKLILTHNGPSSPDTLTVNATGSPAKKFISLEPDSIYNMDVPYKSKKPVKRPKPGKPVVEGPNWSNLVFEVVHEGGFQPNASESDSAGGMVIGISHMHIIGGKWKPINDSAKVRAWVRLSSWNAKKNPQVGVKYAAIQKSLRNKIVTHTTPNILNVPRGLDSTGFPGNPVSPRKRLSKELKKLDPKKTPHKLFAELVAAKFNITASAMGKTPPGLGELVYSDSSNAFDGMEIKAIIAAADTAMTYWQGVPSSYYNDLHEALYNVNRAFLTPMDTTGGSWIVGNTLTLVAGVDLDDAPCGCLIEGTSPPRMIPRTTVTGYDYEEEWDNDEWYDDEWDEALTPVAAKLYQNFPNPFNPATTIAFRLREESRVSLSVYNMLGQEVATLLEDEEMEEGLQAVQFAADGLASGVYFYRVQVQGLEDPGFNTVETGKMLLLK